MNELVIMHNKQAMTTSLRVAEVFGKDHKNVIQSIENLAAEKSAAKFFAEATYYNRIHHSYISSPSHQIICQREAKRKKEMQVNDEDLGRTFAVIAIFLALLSLTLQHFGM